MFIDGQKKRAAELCGRRLWTWRNAVGAKSLTTQMPKLTIIHTSDLHGRLSRRIAAVLRELKARRGAVLLDSGDCTAMPNIIASPWAPPVVKRMAEAGYDAVAVGNREWFFRAAGMRWLARALPCPLVATNIEPAERAGLAPMALLDTAGGKVAVLALARKMVEPRSWLQRLCNHRWIEPSKALAKYLPQARERADWVIVLSHLGLRDDLAIATSQPIDLVLGGHDHILTPRGIVSVGSQADDDGGAGAPVVHSGYYGRWATVVTLRRLEEGTAQVAVEVIRLAPDLAGASVSDEPRPA